MLTKLNHWLQEIWSSFWFVPAVMVLGAVVLAAVLITVDVTVDLHALERWPLVFDAGADGARGLLTAVAGSMITVAGVVFSITLVALSLASSQYTSRVIRQFTRDRVNQVVLGMFVGIFAYCLVVLRTIRGGDEGAFVPTLAVMGGLILAFAGIAFLIYFIHYISKSIQASSIIGRVSQETIRAVDHLFPMMLVEYEDENGEDNLQSSLVNQPWSAGPARQTGYIENIDTTVLLDVALKRETILRMERGIGEFVIEGTPLVSVINSDGLNEETAIELNAAYVISPQRTVDTDVGFGIRQIVDIAMKALSPGINDTTTAVMCVDYLGAILARFADRRMAPSHLFHQGELRVLVRGPRFESLLSEAFDQIRQNAVGNVAIMSRLLYALQAIACLTANPSRRRAIHENVEWIAELAERTIASPYDRTRFERRLACVREVFEAFSHEPKLPEGS